MSELVYAGKSLAEIARYDDYQTRWILFRARDPYGRLQRVDPDLPEGCEVDERGLRIVSRPVPFKKMFEQVQRSQGLSDAATAGAWEAFRAAHPRFGQGGF